jgi:hypothetical protein
LFLNLRLVNMLLIKNLIASWYVAFRAFLVVVVFSIKRLSLDNFFVDWYMALLAPIVMTRRGVVCQL